MVVTSVDVPTTLVTKETVELGAKLLGDLCDLGNTIDAVAAKLRAAGVKGLKMNARHCPVAAYLRSKGYEDVRVGTTITTVGSLLAHQNPPAVVGFINLFDHDAYPDLLEAPAPTPANELAISEVVLP